MKKIFVGVLYIILLVMSFVYVFITVAQVPKGEYLVNQSVITLAAFTGLPVIGAIILIPAVVFTIISLVNAKKLLVFLRDTFTFFTSAFLIAGTVVAIIKYAKEINNLYVPIILLVSTSILLIFSLNGLLKIFMEESKKKQEVIEE